MKYYEYISTRKVDMLFPQIPRDASSKISGTVEVNLPSTYEKIAVIEKWLEKSGDIGTLESGMSWIKDSMHLWWGPSGYADENEVGEVVWFGGIREPDAILLGGSAMHLVGRSSGRERPTSDLPSILNSLVRSQRGSRVVAVPVEPTSHVEEDAYAYALENAFSFCHGKWGGAEQQFEFLALRLLQRKHIEYLGKQWRVTVATPLYVSHKH
jgi:hypothetical protein